MSAKKKGRHIGYLTGERMAKIIITTVLKRCGKDTARNFLAGLTIALEIDAEKRSK